MSEQGPESLTNRVVRGVGLAGSGYALTQMITLATYLVLARLTAPLAFGQYAEAAVLVGIGLLFTESGMLAALIQRRDRIGEAANTALLATLASGIAVSLLALAVSPLIGSFFRSDTVGAVAAAISGQLFLRSATVVPNAMLERRLAFLRRTIVEPLAAVAFAVAAIVAMSHGLGVWGLVIGNYVQIGIDAILTWALARWRPKPRLASLAMWRELVRFGRHVIAAGMVQRVGEQVDRVLVGRFVGTASLGQYQYALRLAMAPFEATLAVASHVLFPAFARISHDRERLNSAFLRSLRWVMVVAMPASLILFPLGEPLAVVLFGEVWRPAGEALMAMCFFGAGNSLLSICLEGAKAYGKPAVLARVHLVMMVTTAAAMIALLPLGLDGVAAGLSVGAVVGGAYAAFSFSRTVEMPLGRIWSEVWAPGAAAVLMAGVLYPVERFVIRAGTHGTAAGLALLALEAVAAALVYLAALSVLSPERGRMIVRLPAMLLERRRPRADPDPDRG
ncbi:MAG: lipopolysaccharide biosynthesis protein [Solirubrobacterales bacterium]